MYDRKLKSAETWVEVVKNSIYFVSPLIQSDHITSSQTYALGPHLNWDPPQSSICDM